MILIDWYCSFVDSLSALKFGSPQKFCQKRVAAVSFEDPLVVAFSQTDCQTKASSAAVKSS